MLPSKEKLTYEEKLTYAYQRSFIINFEVQLAMVTPSRVLVGKMVHARH